MSIIIHCKACDKPFEEHDGIVETCRKLQSAKATLDRIIRHTKTPFELRMLAKEALDTLNEE